MIKNHFTIFSMGAEGLQETKGDLVMKDQYDLARDRKKQVEPIAPEVSVFASQQLRHLKKRINQESGFEIQQGADLAKQTRQAG